VLPMPGRNDQKAGRLPGRAEVRVVFGFPTQAMRRIGKHGS
jgi:hypothetical protein